MPGLVQKAQLVQRGCATIGSKPAYAHGDINGTLFIAIIWRILLLILTLGYLRCCDLRRCRYTGKAAVGLADMLGIGGPSKQTENTG